MHQNENPSRHNYYHPPERQPRSGNRQQYRGGRADYIERQSYAPEYDRDEYDQSYEADDFDRAEYAYDRNQVSRNYRDYDDPYSQQQSYQGSRDYSRNDGAGNRVGQRGLTPNRSSRYGSSYGSNSQQGYGAGYYGGQQGWDQDYGRSDYDQNERGFMDKAGDEVRSWFGDEDAERRRMRDSHRGKGPKGYTRSDSRIEEDVNDYLTHDHYVDASDISVSVSDCEVTLDGTTNSRIAKRRAEDCADAVSGVKHVQNNLRVQQSTGQSESQSADNSASRASSKQSSITH